MLVTDVQETSFRRFSNATGAYVVTLPNYESGGQEFESLRARQHLAPTFRAKNTAILRNLQGTELAPILRLMHSCIDWSVGVCSLHSSQQAPHNRRH